MKLLVTDLILRTISIIAALIKPGGVKSLVAENLALRRQLIVLKRSQKGSPKTKPADRLTLGVLVGLVSPNRLEKMDIAFKPATILRFHKALIKRKYNFFSNKNKRKRGRKPPSEELIALVIDIKTKNPSFGYTQISMQIYQAFGLERACPTKCNGHQPLRCRKDT